MNGAQPSIFDNNRRGRSNGWVTCPESPGHAEAVLSFFGFAEFGDYGEVFESGGVAFDFAVGG